MRIRGEEGVSGGVTYEFRRRLRQFGAWRDDGGDSRSRCVSEVKWA